VRDVQNDKPDAEAAVRSACEAGDFRAATTAALEAYGPQVLSFLTARLRSASDGDEAFSLFAEDLWKGLPGFGFRCSVRSWAYALARNAANRHASAPQHRRERNLAISNHPSVANVIAQARSATAVHQRTDVKAKIRALREQLPPEDQTLLILHVDRGLAWRDLAIVMHDQGEQLDDEALTRESARLRKRFERVRSTLRELAIAEGLLQG
jgi:RNA polymerase sigma-70 factor (ECF subfamily)